jgi:hypothetical protein
MRLKLKLQDDWLPREWIPNRAGYKLTLLLHDGRIVDTHVTQEPGPAGIHVLSGVHIAQVAGWKARQ